MTRSNRFALPTPRVTAVAAVLALSAGVALAQAGNFPITPKQRTTAQQVASEGVALSELSPSAPDSYTVKSGDTLWDISSLFLTSPWRWPELWGMNLDQIRNPHLIYPGQVLSLDKSNGRGRLRVGEPVGGGNGKLSPRVRTSDVTNGIPAVNLAQIEPFLNEAVIFDTEELNRAPRIVSAQENRVLLTRGDLAYTRGDLGGHTSFRVFREPVPLKDPTTDEVLGYEGVYLGTVDLTRRGDAPGAVPAKKGDIVPDTVTVTSTRQEMRTGDRLAPLPVREYINHVPRAPQGEMNGQIVSVYGDAVMAGQNQIVALNRGAKHGLEPGHVLALWRDGKRIVDKTDPKSPTIKLPDERHGLLYVFRVFKGMSYALILTVQDPVASGDRFTAP